MRQVRKIFSGPGAAKDFYKVEGVDFLENANDCVTRIKTKSGHVFVALTTGLGVDVLLECGDRRMTRCDVWNERHLPNNDPQMVVLPPSGRSHDDVFGIYSAFDEARSLFLKVLARKKELLPRHPYNQYGEFL